MNRTLVLAFAILENQFPAIVASLVAEIGLRDNVRMADRYVTASESLKLLNGVILGRVFRINLN